jgi:GT2 family glycosyltransferase
VTAVAAIIVNHSREQLLAECLASVVATIAAARADGEIVVVDNASRDGSVEMVRGRFPDARLVELPENRGFAGGVQAGLATTSAEWVLLVNNDATIDPPALDRMLGAAHAPDVGAVAAQMRFASAPDVVNSAGIAVDVLGVAFDRLLGTPVSGEASQRCEVFGASAGAALYRRRMLDEVGGFDASFFVYLEDVDVAWRARLAGWRTVYEPEAVVLHHHAATAAHGSSFKYFHVGRNRVRLLARNATRRHLVRHGLAMFAYDAGYVVFAAVRDRTLAPLRGRLRGLAEWRRYRASGADLRAPLELEPRRGLLAALRRRAVWAGAGSA